MRYIVQKTDITDPHAYSSEWEKANTGYVSVQNWSGYSAAPETIFKMLRGPEGISILMHTKETNHPHYAVWSPVEVENPDFHLPDFFGTIEFA